MPKPNCSKLPFPKWADDRHFHLRLFTHNIQVAQILYYLPFCLALVVSTTVLFFINRVSLTTLLFIC